MTTKIEVKTATIWALLLALLILVFLLPKPSVKPAQKPAARLFHEKHRPMRTQEELDQEVYAAAGKPVVDYFSRKAAQEAAQKEVVTHAED